MRTLRRRAKAVANVTPEDRGDLNRPGEQAASDAPPSDSSKAATRGRILNAAYCVLLEQGYTGATTREIAARAKVSKRDLYALFGSKQGILAALLEARSTVMQMPLTSSADVKTRADLASILAHYGANLLTEVLRPAPLALHRLALSEADRSPEMARILDEGGRNAARRSFIAFLSAVKQHGLLPDIDLDFMAGRFFALLWGDLLLRILLNVVAVPQSEEIKARAEAATKDFLTLFPAPAAIA